MTNATPASYEVPLKIGGIPVGTANVKHLNSGYFIEGVVFPDQIPSIAMEMEFQGSREFSIDFPTVFNAMFGTKPEPLSDHDSGFVSNIEFGEMPSEGTEDVPCACESDFVGELTALLNRFSAESVSGTPDFILAEYLQDSIKAFNAAVVKRADWRGEPVELPIMQRLKEDTVSAYPESEIEAGDFKMNLAPDNVNVTINNYYGKDN